MRVRILSLLIALFTFAGCSSSLDAYPWRTLNGEPPIIIAHRGDSGNYPEHTLLAYESAIQLEADFIEPDVVLTKDNVAVCRHERQLNRSTDIASISKLSASDGFVENLTHHALKLVRAIQPVDSRPDPPTRLHVPTLLEAIELVERYRLLSGTDAGLYIEIKEPGKYIEDSKSHAKSQDPTRVVLDLLAQFEASGSELNVILQCFDRAETERLAEMTDYPVVWLSADPIDFDNLPKGISGLGLSKKLIHIVDGLSELVEQAHRRGLFVHAWTFRDDRLEGTGFEDGQAEIEAYLKAGVDGVFTDFPKNRNRREADHLRSLAGGTGCPPRPANHPAHPVKTARVDSSSSIKSSSMPPRDHRHHPCAIDAVLARTHRLLRLSEA